MCSLCPVSACPEADVMKLTAGPLGKPVLDLFRDPLLPCVLVCQVLLQMWVLVMGKLGVTAHESAPSISRHSENTR